MQQLKEGSKKTYFLKSFGCKANLSDSQWIEEELAKQGWIPSSQEQSAQLSIVNTCTVTNEAEKQSRKAVEKLRKKNPTTKIIATGCGVQADYQSWSTLPGVELAIPNQERSLFTRLFPQQDNQQPQALTLQHRTTRSFLKIQEGCDRFCTYCIIPLGRGPSRSFSIQEMVQKVKSLIHQGTREVVLTGTNIGDYHEKLEPLILEILSQTSLERLRLSSLDPTEITSELIQIMKQTQRVCRHFHLSLQSPNSKILRLMKRGYSWKHVQECFQRISELCEDSLLQPFIGMDIITGFPEETEEDFELSYESLQGLPWTRLHVFPYSERKGTPATRLPHPVAQEKRVLRAKKLNELSMIHLKKAYSHVLKECQLKQEPLRNILLENYHHQDWLVGYTPHYLRILVRREAGLQANQMIAAMPTDWVLDPSAKEVSFLAKKVC